MCMWFKHGGHLATKGLHDQPDCKVIFATAQVLYPAINELLQAEDWGRWESTLQRIAYDEDHMAAFLASHAESKARLEQHRAERAAHSATELEQL